MEYAVCQIGGKQYKVKKGDTLEVENLNLGKDERVMFDKVLLYRLDATVEIGAPYLKDMYISAKVIDTVKGEKIDVFKFKAKSRYRRKFGHRSVFSKIQIEEIKLKKEKKTEKV